MNAAGMELGGSHLIYLFVSLVGYKRGQEVEEDFSSV